MKEFVSVNEIKGAEYERIALLTLSHLTFSIVLTKYDCIKRRMALHSLHLL